MKLFTYIFIFTLFISPLTTFGLSFVQGTQFLDADSEEECMAIGGESWIEWYNETYCTKAGEETPTPEEPLPPTPPTEEPEESLIKSLQRQVIELLEKLLELLRN